MTNEFQTMSGKPKSKTWLLLSCVTDCCEVECYILTIIKSIIIIIITRSKC